MSTIFSTTSTNPHIDALHAVFSDAKKPIESLVIAHNDPRLIQSLAAALSGQQTAVLELSQDTWDFAGPILTEMLEWAVQQQEIRHIVLVGHSQTRGAKSRGSLISAQPTRQPVVGYSRLLAAMQRHNDLNREAQQRLAAHVAQLSRIPVIRSRGASGELAIDGLFYRAEAGLFLSYDAEANAFRSLQS